MPGAIGVNTKTLQQFGPLEVERQIKRLRFEGEIESQFRSEVAEGSLSRLRVCLWLALALFAVNSAFDVAEVLQSKSRGFEWILPSLAAVGMPAALLYGTSRWKVVRDYAPVIPPLGLMILMVWFGSAAPPSPGPSTTAPLVVSFLHTCIAAFIVSALRTPFYFSLVFVVFFGFGTPIILIQKNSATAELITGMTFYWVAALFLLLGAYLNERADRSAFLLRRSLKDQQERIHSLLQNVLPPQISDRLSREPGIIAEHHPSASVLFADLVGFTAYAGSHSPNQVVGLLNGLFSRFDDLVKHHKVEKIKTVGDAYMVAGGVPEFRQDHLAEIADLALELRGAANAMGVDVRIGLHSGPLIAGVLGTERLMYDLWGPTVNLASRLEGSAKPGTIAVSQAVRDALAETHEFEGPQEIDFKGIGPTPVYLLTRKKIAPLTLDSAKQQEA